MQTLVFLSLRVVHMREIVIIRVYFLFIAVMLLMIKKKQQKPM